MIHKHAVLLLGLVTCLACGSVCGQTSTVVEPPGTGGQPGGGKIGQLGDPAPPLTVLEWIKGKPVRIRPGTNFYAIVFCPLSRANHFAITNLSSLQQKYRDKGLITVVISEEAPEQVRQFVQLNGADMDFTIASDDYAGRTLRDFQLPFRQNRVPQAYVVSQEGKVLWFGHPLTDGMGWVVDEIASGRYDLEQTKKDMLSRDQLQEYLALARQQNSQAEQAGRILLSLRTNDAPALCDLAFKIATDPYIEKRDAALAAAALDRAAQLSSTNSTDIALDRAILLFQTGQQEAGLAAAKNALAAAQNDDDKGQISTNIRAMEARLAAQKNSETNHANGANVPVDKPKP